MAENSFSHPDSAVRHSYPVAATGEGFSTALSLTMQTAPFILLRLGVLLGFTLAAIIWLAIWGGIASLFAGKNGSGGLGALVLFLIGFGAPAGVYFWLRQYVLYLLKLGHVAVLTRLITDGALPAGVNQVAFGKEMVTQRFAQTNILFVVDSLVTGVAAAFNRSLDWISELIPIPGMEGVMKVVHAIVNQATTYTDETIFSYNIARGDENVWRSSRDGLVYYAANVKPILKTAVVAVVIEYVVTFVAFLVCLIPAAIIGRILPGQVAGFAWIFAVILAGVVRATVLRPMFLTMVCLTFHKAVQGQAINETYASTLESVSSKFGQLVEKARTLASESGRPGGAKIGAATA